MSFGEPLHSGMSPRGTRACANTIVTSDGPAIVIGVVAVRAAATSNASTTVMLDGEGSYIAMERGFY